MVASAVLRRSLALLALLVCFSGCGRFRTTRECRRFSEIVETGRREIDRVAAARTPAAYRSSAPLYARVAGQLRLAAGSSELRPSADDYARSVETVGRSVSAYAEALASGDTARESSARRDLESASRKERDQFATPRGPVSRTDSGVLRAHFFFFFFGRTRRSSGSTFTRPYA